MLWAGVFLVGSFGALQFADRLEKGSEVLLVVVARLFKFVLKGGF